MMNHPLVSIVILNWNGRELLRECIDSVLKSSYSPLEIIVSDNASADGSVDFIKENYPSVVIAENPENLGYAEGNNRGIAVAKGTYAVTLNNDSVVDPDWLNKPIEYLENDPAVGVACCRQMNYYNRSVVDSFFNAPAPELIFRMVGHGEMYDSHSRYAIPGYVIAANGGSAIYRREMFLKLGGFDEHYFAYHDETDLCMRAFLNGWKCVYVPQSIVYHKEGASFKKKGNLSHYYYQRNRMWFIFKYFPVSFIARRWSVLVTEEIRAFILHFFMGHGPFIYLKARAHGFAGIFRYLRVRKLYTKKFMQNRSHYIDFERQKIVPL
jgi:GT2 family glycosyltransferase